MTARETFEIACALMDDISDDSVANENGDYEVKAPLLIKTLQREIAMYENRDIIAGVEELDDRLEISEYAGESVLPYGLAAMFAKGDANEDMFQSYWMIYRQLLRTIKPETEEYDTDLRGMQI